MLWKAGLIGLQMLVADHNNEKATEWNQHAYGNADCHWYFIAVERMDISNAKDDTDTGYGGLVWKSGLHLHAVTTLWKSTRGYGSFTSKFVLSRQRWTRFPSQTSQQEAKEFEFLSNALSGVDRRKVRKRPQRVEKIDELFRSEHHWWRTYQVSCVESAYVLQVVVKVATVVDCQEIWEALVTFRP